MSHLPQAPQGNVGPTSSPHTGISTAPPISTIQPASIRSADMGDIDTLYDCWVALSQELESDTPLQPFSGRSANYPALLQDTIVQSIENDDAQIFLAESDGQAIGTIAAYLHHRKDVRLSPVGVIYSLWVEPEQRRYGIGSLLFTHVVDWVRVKRGKALQVAWRADSPISEAFWQSKGFESFEVIAHKPLQPSKA